MDFNKDFTINNIYIDNIGSPSALQDLYACRVCLATDIKLFDIHECDLAESFEAVMGISAPPDDGLPQHLCHYCFTLLQKHLGFREKYNRSLTILQTAALLGQPITTDYLRIIDRDAENLSIPLSIHCTGFIDYEIIEDPDECDNPEEYTLEIEQDSKDNIKREIIEYNSELPVDDAVEQDNMSSVLEHDYIVASDQDMAALDGCTVVEGVNIEEIDENPKPLKMTEHPNITVVTLTHEEQVAEVQARRTSALYLSALHKCDKCYKGFLNSHTYRNHMADHHPSAGPVECPVCEIRVSTGAKLRVHIADEHQRRFICKLCNDQSPTSHRALKHQRTHDGLMYDCKYCEKSFKKASQCVWHSRRAHPVEQVCESCGERCESRRDLARHRLTHHQQPTMSNTETWLHCSSCEVEFRGVSALTKHILTSSIHTQEDNGLNYFCKHCGDSFDTEDKLDDHKVEHVNEMYKCIECDVYCETESDLLFHCGSEHSASVLEGDRFMCEQCGRKFTSSAGLIAHRRSHSMEKPFSCPFCQKSFRFPQYLQIHVRTHTGERPYMCNVCSMAFQAKANLNRHLKVHTGEKPYMCDLCGKSFTQSNSMKVHVKTVHLKMPDPYKDRRKFYRNRNKPNSNTGDE